ncbi:MAG: DEAD/DEAH box helicase [Planctomycetota bacterium]|nr:DEAD/DEAH box helicase [Planctomycetota bacterium]
MPFNEFNLSEQILRALEDIGFVKPTPIQQKALPHGMAGKDVMGQAETGTGKTLAFMLPILEKVDPQRVSVQGLVITPTRELARQIKEEFDKLAPAKKLKVSLLIGGEPIGNQIVELRLGCQIAVGTPGRIIDHLQSRTLTLGWVEHLVLDEGDEMLDMGFIDAIRQILKNCPKERQTSLYSATFPKEVQRLARSCMSDPVQVSTIEGLQTVDKIDQQVIFVSSEDKIDKLAEILDGDDRNIYLVFCQTRRETDVVYRRLNARGYPVAALHGDFSQEHRTKVMERFRKGHVHALIATDVASRGLDIDVITHVINYSVPDDPRRYVHRIGRTGRAGRTGVAITLVSPEERRYLRALGDIAGAEDLGAGAGGDGGTGKHSRRPRNRARGGNRKKDSLKSRRGSRQKHHRR